LNDTLPGNVIKIFYKRGKIMLKKLFLIIVLSSSVSCFAETGERKSNALIDSSQQNRSSSDAKQKSQSSQSAPAGNQGSPQSSQGSGSDPSPKPPMVDYCKKHTC